MAYSASSTSSYMLAMAPMMDILATMRSETAQKTPKVDTEQPLAMDLDSLFATFAELSLDKVASLNAVSEIGAIENTAVVAKIGAECSRVSLARGQPENEVLQLVKQTLVEQNSDEEVQSHLFDILGFDEFELILLILQNRAALLSEENATNDEPDKDPLLLTPQERVEQLIANREKRKNQKLSTTGAVGGKNGQYAHVFKKPDVGNVIAITGKLYLLPAGTTRASYPTHEELIIPYPENVTGHYIKDSQLVRMSQLDNLCQGTFTKYQTLNKMQSLVFPVAYNTNENMLVCAPTGAGKTDVALLTILHTIDQFSTEREPASFDIDYDLFKIVYVAPLKALAAEIVEKYSEKLKWLGIRVRELTGDMQLTRAEITTTQIIVTTPEKWDVITRKQSGDNDLVSKVKLLIIDEVHLLHEDRGSVIETLVARTLRQVESTQLMIRVVGLSATLPNYMDVADFLGVNRNIGMFYFDQLFRPCPLKQELIGARGKAGSKTARENIDRVSYDRLIENLRQGYQVMVFVHSRKDTVKTAQTFINMAQANGHSDLFDASETCGNYDYFKKEAAGKKRSKDLRELFPRGFGMHHAGMFRSDRNLVEKMFLNGAIKVLCCTATLAWGVNLPAAVVIVKGTQVYDAKQGGFVDLGISDVIQIFGRAGRPQFEKFGTGILCTTSDRLDHYVSLITQQHPIESKLLAKLIDNLNAEISLGTVTNIDEGVQWLGYTYMMVRMRQNPFAYGIEWKELQEDPSLHNRRRKLIVDSARRLHALQMIVFDEQSGALLAKDLGRIASDFYLLNNSVEIFNNMLNPAATEADLLAMISMSSEFDNIKFREEEGVELKKLEDEQLPCQVSGEKESNQWKTNVLLQAYVSNCAFKDSSLVSDCNYVAQNSARICRALFLIGINRRWGHFAKIMLSLCKSVDKRIWAFDHPLAQFDLNEQILKYLRNSNFTMQELRNTPAYELGDLVHNSGMGGRIYSYIHRFPYVTIKAEIFPITTQVVRMLISLIPDFLWDDQFHGKTQFFWVFVEDSEDTKILHVEKFILRKGQMGSPHQLDVMIPVSDPPPAQLVIRVLSDTWLGAENVHPVSFQHLITPKNETIRTNLLRLQPLPISALHDPVVEGIYKPRFKYFNPMQTMTFHSLYNTNSNIFVGSPTGSGKTVVAELAIWHAFKEFPKSKVVYIAPMKALVRERVDDWRQRICKNTKHKLVELTGDSLPEAREVREASIIITTPEKFDGISRNWQTRKFVQEVSLVIMDEIHLLASDRGPILEMIVSRMNYISMQTNKPIRLLGMSTAVSNAFDMAGWLRVREGLFNFSQSVRPVPLQMYIDGFPDNLAFCPLMKTMNKPAFMAIKQHSPLKPVLIFVASRRQTRLTALDLIHLCGLELNPRRFLKMDELELQTVLEKVKDETLRLLLQFGMGLHHAGLVEADRQLSHKLFEAGKIQILIATSTLAWGVNLPAHLVIIKGTQFFDSKIEDYRDMDLTDILQMMGRAGRPAFDTSGIAIVYTRESKKVFYKHFLNIGFPVESSLHKVLDDHIGAEIASGTISSRQEALDFLTWTFLYRRAHNNPMYYGIEDTSPSGVSEFLSGLVNATIENLQESLCVRLGDRDLLVPTPYLQISSFYYLSHKTIRKALSRLNPSMDFQQCLQVLCMATEYDELATRHGEELINMELSQSMRFPAEDLECEFIWDPHVKAYLLIQAYMEHIDLPIVDYVQDTVSVLDQALRILQALVEVAAELGYLSVALQYVEVMQCLKQRLWFDENPLCALVDGPGSVPNDMPITLAEVGAMKPPAVLKLADELFAGSSSAQKKKNFIRVASHLPSGDLLATQTDRLSVSVELRRHNEPSSKEFRVHAPYFPKQQKESWFVILCDKSQRELYSLRRASPEMSGKRGRVHCKVEVDEKLCGKEIVVLCVNDAMKISYKQTLKLMS
ncbi:hypothetical protein PUMCH_001697 [Australozyma saopauloensis]|uniref:RNA helicase n=1 Tax=Australozyma saopauloensis TaxID=291208 RepID=A0AAX4H7G3_9ASCO|nr:hypothetical protein PUMCH_001697 [[Candida] saopauloensis]